MHVPTSSSALVLSDFRRRILAWPVLLLALLALIYGAKARAQADNENTTPTAWWMETGQTFAQIQSVLSQNNARIIDIKVDSTLSHYTVTYVENQGSYAKSWWWYVGISGSELSQVLTNTGARLISLQPYDSGNGTPLFNVAMIANTGADAKAWWYYYDVPESEITSIALGANARLTTLQSYTLSGETYYSFIMISNTGADAREWWWHAGATAQQISGYVSNTNSRILDLTAVGNGTFNVVQESCPSSGCPEWWWYTGVSGSQVIGYARDHGARAFAADPAPGCTTNCLAAVLIDNTPTDVTACDPEGCISEAQLSAQICAQLENQVVGYVCLVGQMRPVYGGLAQTSTDSPPNGMAMTPDLTTNVASVSKTMTATAVLQLLAKDGLSIDTPIQAYLYSDWARGGNINNVTFRELLNHTSGLGELSDCPGASTYSQVESIVAEGPVAADIGVMNPTDGLPRYGNCNFSLLRELLPALLGQNLVNSYPDGSARAAESSALYVSYLQSHVFVPVAASDASCKPPSGNTGILSYPYPAGTANGTNWGDQSLQCGASGWQLSAFDTFDVVSSLASNTTLLSTPNKADMMQNCLGWDCAVNRVCPTPYVCKNGALFGGPQTATTQYPQVWTYAGILKCNVPVVLVVNSPLPPKWEWGGNPGSDTIGIVDNAYQSSSVAGVGPACTQ